MARSRGARRLEAARARMYRELVFEAAEHVFARQGYDEASMQAIAAEAGVSLKTVYAVFPGKQELYAEILVDRGREFVEAIAAGLEGVSDSLELLERGVRGYVDFLVGHDDFLRLHLRERSAWGLDPGDEDSTPDWQRGVGIFAELLRGGMDAGVFYEGDAEAMTMMGIAVMQVELVRAAEREGAIDAEALSAEILVQLRRLLCPPAVETPGVSSAHG